MPKFKTLNVKLPADCVYVIVVNYNNIHDTINCIIAMRLILMLMM